MKKLLMIGAALTLVSGVAFAEFRHTLDERSADGDQRLHPEIGQVAKADFEHPGPQGKWRHDGRHGWDKRGPEGQRFGRWHPGGMMASKGARILLERHGNKIAVKCAEGDSTQQCVDAVKDLMGSIAATMRHGRPGDMRHPPQDDQQETPDGQDGPSQ